MNMDSSLMGSRLNNILFQAFACFINEYTEDKLFVIHLIFKQGFHANSTISEMSKLNASD